MSYRLVDANALALSHKEVNDMPCIYADLPHGLDDGYYDLVRAERTCMNIQEHGFECSECDFFDAYADETRINYCPNCGRVVEK